MAIQKMTTTSSRWGLRGTSSIFLCLHLTTWLTFVSIGFAIYLFMNAPEDTMLKASAILLVVSAFGSLLYIYLHCLMSSRSDPEYDAEEFLFKRPQYVAIRLAALIPVLWLLTAGWGLIVAARRAICLPASRIDIYGQWQAGSACVLHRASVAVASLLLIVTCFLFAIIATNHHCFETNLLGTNKAKSTGEDDVKATTVSTEKVKQVFTHSRGLSSVSSNGRSTPSTPLPAYQPPHPGRFAYMSPSLNGSMIYSRPSTAGSGLVYSQSRNGSHISLQMPGYPSTMQPAHFPPPMMDSAWRAVHPPAYQFRHVATPSRPWTPLSMASVPPSPYAGSIRSQALYSASHSQTQSRAGSVNSYGLHQAPNGAVLRSSPSSRSLSSRSTNSAGSSRYTPPRSRHHHQRSVSDTTNTYASRCQRLAASTSPSSASISRPPTRADDRRSLDNQNTQINKSSALQHSNSTSPFSIFPHSAASPASSSPPQQSSTHHAQALETHLRNLQRRKELKKKLRAGKIDLDPFSGRERRRSLDTLPRAVRKFSSSG